MGESTGRDHKPSREVICLKAGEVKVFSGHQHKTKTKDEDTENGTFHKERELPAPEVLLQKPCEQALASHAHGENRIGGTCSSCTRPGAVKPVHLRYAQPHPPIPTCHMALTIRQRIGTLFLPH